jgi:hypothetical protein
MNGADALVATAISQGIEICFAKPGTTRSIAPSIISVLISFSQRCSKEEKRNILMMLKKSNDAEKREDDANDVGGLKHVDQELFAKRIQIEALIAEEQELGPIVSEGAKQHLRSQVDMLLEEWEREKNEDGVVSTGSVAFNKLASEYFDLLQQASRNPKIPSEPRRLPAPWRIIEHADSFEIQDAIGHKIAYVYFEDGQARRDMMNRLTSDEARRVASNIAKLPQLARP